MNENLDNQNPSDYYTIQYDYLIELIYQVKVYWMLLDGTIQFTYRGPCTLCTKIPKDITVFYCRSPFKTKFSLHITEDNRISPRTTVFHWRSPYFTEDHHISPKTTVLHQRPLYFTEDHRISTNYKGHCSLPKTTECYHILPYLTVFHPFLLYLNTEFSQVFNCIF